MPANILIIDDMNVPENSVPEGSVHDKQPYNWMRRVTITTNTPTLISGKNHHELLQDFKRALRKNGGASFDGAILDIIIGPEKHGGIKFWQALIRENLVRHAGILMISTNSNYDDDPEIVSFAKRQADGRIYGDKEHDARSMRRLSEFLRLIPHANQWPP